MILLLQLLKIAIILQLAAGTVISYAAITSELFKLTQGQAWHWTELPRGLEATDVWKGTKHKIISIFCYAEIKGNHFMSWMVPCIEFSADILHVSRQFNSIQLYRHSNGGNIFPANTNILEQHWAHPTTARNMVNDAWRLQVLFIPELTVMINKYL